MLEEEAKKKSMVEIQQNNIPTEQEFKKKSLMAVVIWILHGTKYYQCENTLLNKEHGNTRHLRRLVDEG